MRRSAQTRGRRPPLLPPGSGLATAPLLSLPWLCLRSEGCGLRDRGTYHASGRVQVSDRLSVLDAIVVRPGQDHGDLIEVVGRGRRGDLPLQAARLPRVTLLALPRNDRRPDEVDHEQQDRE